MTRWMCVCVVVWSLSATTCLAQGRSETDLLCGVKCLYTGLLALGVDPGKYSEFITKCGSADARGYSIGRLEEIAKGFGVETLPVQTSLENLQRREGRFVCIAHVDENHFVNIGDVDGNLVWIVDPPRDGPVAVDVFAQKWKGTALLLSRVPLVPENKLRWSVAGFWWGAAGVLGLAIAWVWRRRARIT